MDEVSTMHTNVKRSLLVCGAIGLAAVLCLAIAFTYARAVGARVERRQDGSKALFIDYGPKPDQTWAFDVP